MLFDPRICLIISTRVQLFHIASRRAPVVYDITVTTGRALAAGAFHSARPVRTMRPTHAHHAGTDSKVYIELHGCNANGIQSSSGEIELHSSAVACHALDPKAQVSIPRPYEFFCCGVLMQPCLSICTTNSSSG